MVIRVIRLDNYRSIGDTAWFSCPLGGERSEPVYTLAMYSGLREGPMISCPRISPLLWPLTLLSTPVCAISVSQINPAATSQWGLVISLSVLLGCAVLAVLLLSWRLHKRSQTLSHYQAKLDLVSDSLIELDREGTVLAVIHTRYPSERALLAVVGHRVREYLEAEQANVFDQHLEAAFEQHDSRTFRLDAQFDRKAVHLLCRIYPQGKTREAKGAVLVITDVTRFKEAERTLESARQQAEQLASARAGFLANMSHELRTPLAGIVGMVSLLEDAYASDEMHQYTQPLLSSVDHLRRIVDDVLELAKADGGNIVLEERDVCLWQILDDLEGLFAQQALQKGVAFTISKHPQAPRYAHLDGFRLRQVLYNLVGNAVKFTSEGRIGLDIGVRQLADRAFLHFSVTDTGEGIDPQQQQRIFDAFTQADASVARQHGGTGLGLSICKKLVELMGGVLEVQSELGHGSTFWFTVPLQTAHDPDDVSYWRQRGVRIQLSNPQDEAWMQQFFAGLGIAQQEDGELLVTDQRPLAPAQWVWWLGADHIDSVDTKTDDTESGNCPVLWLQPPLRRMVLLGRLMNDCAPKNELTEEDAPSAREPMEQHILVVEDNPTNELVLRRLLEKMGYQVTSASNGKEGVEAWSKGQFAAIIMDVQMPIMDGIEATRTIREREGNAYTPIIALTANAQNTVEEACFSAGTDAFLTKPVDRSQLQNTLATVLGGHKVSTSA